ncbi:hypothetical protein GWR56_11725 [Mucilaginibacter sp. 14171R-50]|uniref:hypothetical protein n=1 Tax=Mucilaginibacter sp. 14171R-50 TaxID=2703789 RepID=UPI00138B9002|nr:hypothetical protein [Mucilaginibacter sp. 14171R-50]QHS56172.1 hypothetical protein GWR56_11725 [Mucilaginibacter sp. 14171R-50]
MKGYVNIPKSIYCKTCKHCGTRPIIALIDNAGYVVKCPKDDNHYQTTPGLIDIEDWNIHNTVLYEQE